MTVGKSAQLARATAPSLDDLRACRAFMLDFDGTMFVDDQEIEGASEFLALLETRGIPYVFVTNNSSRSGDDYVRSLQTLGLPIDRSKVFTSGDATIEHLLSTTQHRSAYLVGTPALEGDFRAGGLELTSDDPDCVVVGFDTTLTFDKLEIACRHLFAGVPYYATHPDKTCITQRGLIPDIAAIIAACEAVTGRLPEIIGKPYPGFVDAALRRLGTAADHTAMVGDQLDTDMEMAQNCGLVGVLVMSGETTPDKLAAAPENRRRFVQAADIGDVLRWLR